MALFGNLIMPSVGHAVQQKKFLLLVAKGSKKNTDGQHY